MNTITKYSIFLIIVMLSSFQLSAQSKCKNYLEKKCGGFGAPYKFSGQSRSASFEVGQSSSLKMSAFSGFEYCVTLCATKQLKGIYFRIVEDTPQKTVLYDGGSDESGMLQKEFYIEDSKKLLIEVVSPESDQSIEEMDYDRLNGCVGIIIEYHKIGQKGF